MIRPNADDRDRNADFNLRLCLLRHEVTMSRPFPTLSDFVWAE